jgi:hypothetical protein
MPARPPLFDDVGLALLREGQAVRFRAAGLSMEPSIRDGDAITVVPVSPDAVRRGDVLLYRAGERLLAHRVIGPVEGVEGFLRVRADAPGWEEERVPASDVFGRVEAVERGGRPVAWRGPLARRVAALARRIRRRLSGVRTSASCGGSQAASRDSRKD